MCPLRSDLAQNLVAAMFSFALLFLIDRAFPSKPLQRPSFRQEYALFIPPDRPVRPGVIPEDDDEGEKSA